MITAMIDGQQVIVAEGTNIVEAALKTGGGVRWRSGPATPGRSQSAVRA